MPNIAAHKYYDARDMYRRICDVLTAMPHLDPGMQEAMRRGALQRTRAIFRTISSDLTRRTGAAFCTGNGGAEKPHTEHAVPLRLIHDRILGVTASGKSDPTTWHMFDTAEAIQKFVASFVVGVLVAPSDHTALNKEFKCDMPKEWEWDEKAEGNAGVMGRYRSIGLAYHPRGGCMRCR
jgi:hypothetical protein